MNPVLQSLYTRKSVRVFLPKSIGAQEKEAILLAASNAPSAGNQQQYTILDITDPALKAHLAVSCDNQPFIATAPMVLLFCADVQKWYDAYDAASCDPRMPGVGDLMLAVQDAVIAAQNAVTAAWGLGIGSCYIGDILEHFEENRALFHLPPYVTPATMVVFGYPDDQQLKREKPERQPLSKLVAENQYPVRSGNAWVQTLGAHSAAKPPAAWVQAFCERKYQSDFAREMNRSVAVSLQSFLQGGNDDKQETQD